MSLYEGLQTVLVDTTLDANYQWMRRRNAGAGRFSFTHPGIQIQRVSRVSNLAWTIAQASQLQSPVVLAFKFTCEIGNDV